MFQSTSSLLIQLILSKLASSTDNVTQPLFVGLQGPPGIGKTSLTKQIREELLQTHNINAIVISLDDFYLTRKEQEFLEQQLNPNNRLIRGRGLPGTHDLKLAKQTLLDLRDINQSKDQRRIIQLPVYDKSIQNGLGDRLGFTKIHTSHDQIVRVVILEGWMVGFLPLETNHLKFKFDQSQNDPDSFISKFTWEELFQINRNLNDYVDSIWSFFDLWLILIPQDLNYVWSWRLEQEAQMKSKNGGIGMSEEQVQKFVLRYMPCCELYGKRAHEEEIVREEKRVKSMKYSFKIILDQDRKVVDVKFPVEPSPQS